MRKTVTFQRAKADKEDKNSKKFVWKGKNQEKAQIKDKTKALYFRISRKPDAIEDLLSPLLNKIMLRWLEFMKEG